MSRHLLLSMALLASLSFAAGHEASAASARSGFLANRGQLDARVRYQLPGAQTDVYLTGEGLVFDLKSERTPARASGCAVAVRFDGSNPAAAVTASDPLRARHNYFLGNDPDRWCRDVPAFGEIVYHDLWPGVDLTLREEAGALRYDLAFREGADLASVRISFEGAARVARDGGIDLIETPAGTIAHRAPVGKTSGYFSTDPNPKRPPRARSGSHSPSALLWSSFLGGGGDEIGWSVTVDTDGNPLVTGLTLSSRFPTSFGSYDRHYSGVGDVFVTKLDKTGQEIIWSTLLGGSASNFDYGNAIAIDSAGNAVVTGYTWSNDFPTTPGAFDRSFNGLVDVFVAKISAGGNQLLWSTFLGGGDFDIGYSVAFDDQDRPVVTGRTLSASFPTTPGAFERNLRGEEDVFVTKLEAGGGSLAWSTLVGGSFYDAGQSIKLDANARVIVAGYTASDDFPTTAGAHSRFFTGGLYDVFVFALSADGSSLAWGTYVGGSDYEYGNDLVLDADGNAVVVGATASTDYPTTPGSYDESHNGGEDAFVTKVDHTNGSLVWSTFLGGASGYIETAYGGAIDRGQIVLVGGTTASDFPTTPGAYDRTVRGATDVFLSRLSGDGKQLFFSTLLGGQGDDYANSVAVDQTGNALVTGVTGSIDFPTTRGAFDESFGGGEQDIFVLKIARLAVGH